MTGTPQSRLDARLARARETGKRNACWNRFGGVSDGIAAKLDAMRKARGVSMDVLLAQITRAAEKYGL